MDDDPFPGHPIAGDATDGARLDGQPLVDREPPGKWELRPIELADQPILNRYLRPLAQPLSDYTFSQIFTWRNSLRLLWREIDDHLCVFANGAGDLTLLIPPIGPAGPGGNDVALRRAFELMDDYNASHGVPDRSRIEYVSQELLATLDRRGLSVQPMGHDYIYQTQRMIDLAGGDLKSKRQEKNRFIRDNRFTVEPFIAAKHLQPCLNLLESWKLHQDAHHLAQQEAGDQKAEANLASFKRQKETLATELALKHADELGLSGIVVFVNDALRAFTFGEPLGTDQASIVIEKTDLSIKGLAQFIFSEFCRLNWSDRPLINAGDDWGLESLAWTKASYRPVKLLEKFVLCKEATAFSASGFQAAMPTSQIAEQGVEQKNSTEQILVRPASLADLSPTMSLEETCFDTYCLSKRQLRYLQRSPNAVFQIAEKGGSIVGECIALIRHHKKSLSGRLYSLAVHPNHRGHGIGNRLLQKTLAGLVANGVKRVFLEVEQANAAALKLYERHGFRSIGLLPDYYGEGRPGVHMVCELLIPAAQDIKSAA
jgi:ribosomal protein S18 acetylase RimI-like enzyme